MTHELLPDYQLGQLRAKTICPEHGFMEEGTFCHQCGSTLVEPKRCGGCDREVSVYHVFCRYCGVKL